MSAVLPLDAAWLREAMLPITVDPLVGPMSIPAGGFGSRSLGLQLSQGTCAVPFGQRH